MKAILVCGARPNFIKVAPLIRAIAEHNISSGSNSITPILVHTGQHYDYHMSQIFFSDLNLPEPDIHLGVKAGTHAEQTGKTMIEFEKVLFKEKPDLVIVVGDVNSTLATALVAVKLTIPIAHVEAGPRLYNLAVPEEVNRLLTDIISDYLFAPSRNAVENLRNEGIAEEKIFFVGNIMADSLLSCREKALQNKIVDRLGLVNQSYALLTMHRPDNVDDEPTFRRLISAIGEVSSRIPVIFPAHPRTKKNIKYFGLEGNFLWLDTNRPAPVKSHHIYLTEPMGYLDFLTLQMNSSFVMTDSGGVQTETTVLNVPCLTLYRNTVWRETVIEGTNILVGSDPEVIKTEAFKILEGGSKRGSCPELWDGKTAQRIVKIISQVSR